MSNYSYMEYFECPSCTNTTMVPNFPDGLRLYCMCGKVMRSIEVIFDNLSKGNIMRLNDE
jgi:hypothetical protein